MTCVPCEKKSKEMKHFSTITQNFTETCVPIKSNIIINPKIFSFFLEIEIHCVFKKWHFAKYTISVVCGKNLRLLLLNNLSLTIAQHLLQHLLLNIESNDATFEKYNNIWHHPHIERVQDHLANNRYSIY